MRFFLCGKHFLFGSMIFIMDKATFNLTARLGLIKISAGESFLTKLLSKINPNRGNELFGKAIADKAKQFGITGIVGHASEGQGMVPVNLSKVIENSFLKNIFKDRAIHIEDITKPDFLLKNKNRFITTLQDDLPGILKAEGIQGRQILAPKNFKGFDNDKLKEYKVFKKWLPETIDLNEFSKQVYSGAKSKKQRAELLKNLLQKRFGGEADNWVIKLKGGANTQKTVGSKNPNLFLPEHDELEKLFSHPATKSKRNLSEWLAQPNLKLEATSGFPKFLEDQFRKIPDSSSLKKLVDPFIAPTWTGKAEYRVHSLNGKVIPYASTSRGSGVQAILDTVTPFRTRKIREAEAYAQKILDDLPKTQRNKAYGFDIGFNTKNKPVFIEANPADTGGFSGFSLGPIYQDALNAAIKGELPNYVKLRRLAAAGGAGGTALGINSLIDGQSSGLEQATI